MTDATSPAKGNHGAHVYRVGVSWAGSTGAGYDSYERRHRWWVLDADRGTEVRIGNILSNDPVFGGDHTLVNPEQLVVAAAASCQLFSFLAVVARARVDVIAYEDEAIGSMPHADGPMALDHIELHPTITVRPAPDGKPADDRLDYLVEVAHRACFIANSLRTEVTVDPMYIRA